MGPGSFSVQESIQRSGLEFLGRLGDAPLLVPPSRLSLHPLDVQLHSPERFTSPNPLLPGLGGRAGNDERVQDIVE